MSDQQAIVDVALDYIEGWYTADAARMDRALSSHLAKRRIVSADEIWHIEKPQMVELTGAGRGKLDNPECGRREVEVLDVHGPMASVKIVSENFTDCLHLARLDGEWRIVNVLWEFHDPSALA